MRILLWLVLLLAVALYVQGQRLFTTNWAQPLEVAILPIRASDPPSVDRYIEALAPRDFIPIDHFFEHQAKKYGVPESRPFVTRLHAPLDAQPPAPPNPRDSFLTKALWGLRFRIWAWLNSPDETNGYRQIRVFAVYHPPDTDEPLPHSLGIQGGLLGLVHLRADNSKGAHNNVIIAHEVLHTVGASDKYDGKGQPRLPDGLANPSRNPLFPQSRAEIMAGSIAINESVSLPAERLAQCIVGSLTAKEIGWLASP